MRPHRRIRLFLLAGLLALAFSPSPSRAATIVLPLPELIGEYPQRVLSVHIDLGTSFVSIDGVRLHVAGTVDHGLRGSINSPGVGPQGAWFMAQLEPQLTYIERPTAYAGAPYFRSSFEGEDLFGG